MDVLDTIRARKSIRGYKPAPVPKEVLSQILDVARHAPSAMNTQPWEITVITGDVLASISKENIERLTSGVTPNPDVPPVPHGGNAKQVAASIICPSEESDLLSIAAVSAGDRLGRIYRTSGGQGDAA